MEFEHERIEESPPANRMAFCLTEDLTGNGYPDVIVGALGDEYYVDIPLLDSEVDLLSVYGLGPLARRLQTNVFWYENPGWERHDVARAPELSVGGSLGDVTGDGSPDMVAGQNIHRHKLWWFEMPDDPRERWTKSGITDEFQKYHDTAIADVDGIGPMILQIVILPHLHGAMLQHQGVTREQFVDVFVNGSRTGDVVQLKILPQRHRIHLHRSG
jgi:hypothetical protein